MISGVPSVEVLGVHRVDAPEPCHLVEVLIRDSTGPVDLAHFTQDASPLPRSEWQVPYDEHLVSETGAGSLWRWRRTGHGSATRGSPSSCTTSTSNGAFARRLARSSSRQSLQPRPT